MEGKIKPERGYSPPAPSPSPLRGRDGPLLEVPVTPKSWDLLPPSATSKPSAAKPRFSISRTAAARLGIRRENRQLSTASSSSGVNIICRRSPRVRSALTLVSFGTNYVQTQQSSHSSQIGDYKKSLLSAARA